MRLRLKPLLAAFREDPSLSDTVGSFCRWSAALALERSSLLDTSKVPGHWLILNGQIEQQTPFFARNLWVIDAFSVIGGGGLSQLFSSLRSRRVGGSTSDKLKYLKCYADARPGTSRSTPDEVLTRHYGGEWVPEAIAPLSHVLGVHRQNLAASPGDALKWLKFKKKRELRLSVEAAFTLWFARWTTNSSAEIPDELWFTASRPKLLSLDKVESKVYDNKPLARVISVAGPLEPFLGLPLYAVVERKLRHHFKAHGHGVAIGVNRNSAEWGKLSDNFKGASAIFSGDYTRFDTSVSKELLLEAFDLIVGHLDLTDPVTHNYVSNYRQYFDKKLASREYVADGRFVVPVDGGVPSGSIWTSVINSLVNVIAIQKSLSALQVTQYKYVVYGDDFIIILYEAVSDSFCTDFALAVSEQVGLNLDLDGSYLSRPDSFFVTYERPVYDVRADLAHTADLKVLRTERSSTPFTSFNHADGTTHRWNYTFSGRVKFLQYYWLESGLAIRPWPETRDRLINPEVKLTSRADSFKLIVSHYVDNFNNAHARNWLYQLGYDVWLQRWHSPGSSLAGMRVNSVFRGILTDPTNTVAWLRGTPRGWYRRETVFPNLKEHAFMGGFNALWDHVEELAASAANGSLNVEPYQVRKLIMESKHSHVSPKPPSHNGPKFCPAHAVLNYSALVSGIRATLFSRTKKLQSITTRQAYLAQLEALAVGCVPLLGSIDAHQLDWWLTPILPPPLMDASLHLG